MDFREKNILPSKKVFLGSDQDLHVKIHLVKNAKNLEQYERQAILDIAEQFDKERQESNKYRISLSINHISLLNQLSENPNELIDLFNNTEGDCTKNFLYFKDYFDVFICYLSDLEFIANDEYYGIFKPLTSVNDVDIIDCGFYNNLYTDKIYQCIFNTNVDFENLRTQTSNNRFTLPVNDLYVFFRFKNLNQNFYTHTYNEYNFGVTYTQNGFIDNTKVSNGILGYKYKFNIKEYNLEVIDTFKNKIGLNLPSTSFSTNLNYEPFIKIPLVEYFDTVRVENVNDVGEDQIPDYAFLLKDSTNDNTLSRVETLNISNTNFFTGTTRLVRTDPQGQTPRKLIFNPNKNKFVYFLDKNVYKKDINLIIKRNGDILEYGLDYIYSQEEIYNEIYFNFIPLLNDTYTFEYKYGENYVFRDLKDKGFIDPENGEGINYPFLNGYHYIYKQLEFVNEYDFSDFNTSQIFTKFIFNQNNELSNNNNNFTSDDC